VKLRAIYTNREMKNLQLVKILKILMKSSVVKKVEHKMMFSSVLNIPISFSGNKMLLILSMSTVCKKLNLITGILVFRKKRIFFL